MRIEEGFSDAVHCISHIKFDWRDRLHILFHGKCEVHSVVATEHLPGATKPLETTISVPWIMPHREEMGCAEAPAT